LMPASRNGSHQPTYPGYGVGTKDAQAAAARDGLRLCSSTKITPRCRHCVPVQPAKEKDGYTRQEFQTEAVSQRGRRANDKIRPTRSKEHLDDPEGKDRNPQSCRTPRWTEVRRKRLSRVVRRSTSQLCQMPVWLASRPRGPLSGPHSLRATRIVPLWTPGRGDLAAPPVLFPQQSGRFVLASIRARRIAMIESPIAAASLALRPATFLGGHVNANHRARR
jgi:hypothetical protein